MYDLSVKVLIADNMLTMKKIVTKASKDIGFTNLIEAADERAR